MRVVFLADLAGDAASPFREAAGQCIEAYVREPDNASSAKNIRGKTGVLLDGLKALYADKDEVCRPWLRHSAFEEVAPTLDPPERCALWRAFICAGIWYLA